MQSDFAFTYSSKNTPTASATTTQTSYSVRSVDLTLSSSNATEMAIFIDEKCSVDTVKTWEPYASLKNITLPNVDGPHQVSVIFRSATHFPSECVNLNLKLDRTGPTAPTPVALTENVSSLNSSVKFTFGPASDLFSDVVKYQTRVVNQTAGGIVMDWTDFTTIPVSTPQSISGLTLLEGYSYSIEVRGVDSAGNLGTPSAAQVFHAGPVVTLADRTFTDGGVYALTFSLSSPAFTNTTITYSMSDSTAINGYDYNATSGTVVIPSGQSSGTALVSVRKYYYPGPRRAFDVNYSANFAKSSGVAAKMTVPWFSNMPTTLPSATLATNITQLVGAKAGTCMVKSNSEVYCAGGTDGGSGELHAHLSGKKMDFGAAPITIQKIDSAASFSEDEGFSCALLGDSTVKCWGNSGSGIGNGTTGFVPNPTDIPGLANIIDIGIGNDFACAVSSSGAVKCWGDNSWYQLGVISAYPNNTELSPVDVTGFENPGPTDPKITQLAVGGQYVCGLVNDGSVVCWGRNSARIFGSATPAQSATPVTVPGLPVVTKVFSGQSQSCAITADNDLYCWGYNGSGILGLPVTTTYTVPILVSIAGKVQNVTFGSSTGHHMCAQKITGEWGCWGSNKKSELGTPFYGLSTSFVPAPTVGAENFTLLSAFEDSTCGLTNVGNVYCWGYTAGAGLPYSSVGDSRIPMDPLWMSDQWQANDIIAYDTKYGMTCVQDSTERVRCWGYNSQLGASSMSDYWPLQLTLLGGDFAIKTFAIGYEHICYTKKSDSKTYCKGRNTYGQLGNNTTTDSSSFVQVQGLPSNIVKLKAGVEHTCAISSIGLLYCWGNGADGRLGFAATTALIAQAVPVLPLSDVALGAKYSCGLTTDKDVYCWGNNGSGQLGLGHYIQTTTPTKVSNLANVESIKASTSTTCALTTAGVMWCWGQNGFYQLANTTTTPSNTPQVITQLSNVKSIGISAFGACAVISNGKIYCWGFSTLNGNGSSTQTTEPGIVSNIEGMASSIELSDILNAAGTNGLGGACALFKAPGLTGTIRCWGGGVLGTWGTSYRLYPMRIDAP